MIDVTGQNSIRPDLYETAKVQSRTAIWLQGGALQRASEALSPDEYVEAVIGGYLDGKQSVLVLTDKRVISAWFGMRTGVASCALRDVRQVTSDSTLLTSSYTVYGAGITLKIEKVIDKIDFGTAVNQRSQF